MAGEGLVCGGWNFDLGWNNALQDTMFYPAYIVKVWLIAGRQGIAFGVMDPLENVSEDQMIQGLFRKTWDLYL